MKILELLNLEREEGQIFYLRKYTCNALIELPTAKFETPVSFSIETTPLGVRNIDLSYIGNVNYPIIPVKKALKEFILQKDIEGFLPC